MGVYIKGIGIISPQKTFDAALFTDGILSFAGNRLKCIEPDYSHFIETKLMRRMSRVIKMSVASSVLALKEAGLERPAAIITGTAFGCLEDTDVFLKKLVQNNEEMLTPTAFIHSTHNTISSQIALLSGSHGYNSTYVHRNISFESALLDAVLLMKENAVDNVLVGGVDELTDSSFVVLNRLGQYKREPEVNSGNLYTLNSKGSVAGEGAAFFALVNQKDKNCYAEIRAVRTISFQSTGEVTSVAKALVAENGIEKADLLITGRNGDCEEDPIFEAITEALNMQKKTLCYKHLCGEYPTSSAFATWMGAETIRNRKLHPVFGSEIESRDIRNILIYNQSKSLHHSLILLSAC